MSLPNVSGLETLETGGGDILMKHDYNPCFLLLTVKVSVFQNTELCMIIE